MELCRCACCVHFTPDPVGSGLGIGSCTPYEDYRRRGANAAQMEKAFRLLGNKVFWAGNDGRDDRYCEKFEGQ